MHLEKEQVFYKANKTQLRSKYAGKRVVIASDNDDSCRMLGVYDSDREAIQETVKAMPRSASI